MEQDTPLGMIVGGTRNREIKTRPLLIKIREALDRKEYTHAVELCDTALKINPVGCGHLAGVKFEVLLKDLKDTSRAYDFANEAVFSTAHNNFSALAQIAALIVQDSTGVQEQYLDLAFTAAMRAEELGSGTNADLANTLARIFFLKKQFAEAVRYQARVVIATDGDAKADAEKRLAEYRKLAGE